MAKNDLILVLNTATSGTEFTEKVINIGKGGLLTAVGTTDLIPTVLTVGTNDQILVADSTVAKGIKWTNQKTLSDLGGQSTANLSVDITTDGDSDTMYPSVKAVKDHVSAFIAVADAMIFKGTVGSGGTISIAALNALTIYDAGWTYKVIEAGTIKGKICAAGNLLVATVDRLGSGNIDADWVVVQSSSEGMVTGPVSATDSNVVVFDGTTGKIVKDSGMLLSEFITKSTYGLSGEVIISTGDSTIDVILATALMNLMIVTAPTAYNSDGVINLISFDNNYFYRCRVTGTSGAGRWTRTTMSSVW